MVSLLLHGAAVWSLLPHGGAREGGAAAVDEPAAIEVELVNQAEQVKGAPSAPATQPPPSPAAPPLQKEAEAGLPPPPPPAPQTEAAPGPAAPQMAVNLNGSDEDLEGLSVSGSIVRPPSPDAQYRNKPPAYPAEAVRRRAEGTVGLRIHVVENGAVGWVDVMVSSGTASLDRAARDAAALWRFKPAEAGGKPVAFDYDMTMTFHLD